MTAVSMQNTLSILTTVHSTLMYNKITLIKSTSYVLQYSELMFNHASAVVVLLLLLLAVVVVVVNYLLQCAVSRFHNIEAQTSDCNTWAFTFCGACNRSIPQPVKNSLLFLHH